MGNETGEEQPILPEIRKGADLIERGISKAMKKAREADVAKEFAHFRLRMEAELEGIKKRLRKLEGKQT